jgi:hypothetical protein
MTFRLLVLPFFLAAAFLSAAHAHDTDSQSGPLGKVSFSTSCDPKVQAQFERAVAMLHSFWYSAGERAFKDVLQGRSQLRDRHLGIAAIQMSNPLAGQGRRPRAPKSRRPRSTRRAASASKTDRERDYVDAVARVLPGIQTRSERERQVARAQAYEALARKYPADDEAQIFAALYTAGTQTQSDQTYAAYLKPPRFSRSSSRSIPIIRGRALPDSTATTRRRSRTRAHRRARYAPSRRPRRTRCTCRRTSSPHG